MTILRNRNRGMSRRCAVTVFCLACGYMLLFAWLLIKYRFAEYIQC